MKELIASLLLASAAVAPMTAKADENRVNLWPFVGYNDGALDVIWPLGHFKDTNEWRFFPIIEDNGLFCVFPEFWFGRNEFAILPFASKYDFSAGTLFPVWWWGFEKGDTFHTLFPAYYCHRYGKDTIFWAGCGLAGYMSNGKTSSHWLAPVYLKSRDLFLSIPYSRVNREPPHTDAFLCGLAGYKCDATGVMTENWCLPLWIKDDHSLVTLLYSRKWGANGETMSWFMPLVLSGGWQEHTAWKERYLLGLGGRTADGKTGFNESWCAPFYYANNRGTLVTPLYGRCKDSQWCFPLYHYNGENGNFTSLPYGRYERGSQTNTWWVTPLVGTRSGSKEGGWIFPLFNRESRRTVRYDVKTRKRKGERTESETMALCGFFCREQDADTERKTSHARTRILWKLWDREEENGNVTVDAFPCFTYDSKTNGYLKTSFLWRFFRYEKDPADGSTALDLFFLPLSR